MNRTIFKAWQAITRRRKLVRSGLFFFTPVVLTAVFLSGSCQLAGNPDASTLPFRYPFFKNDHWKGKAEIAIYTGKITRYKQKRDARLAMITVLEPFNMQQRVKALKSDQEYAIKQNQSLTYQTGVYPYSQLNSIFWRYNDGRFIKASMTSQEWCGHSFKEAISAGSQLKLNYNSYWEDEASGSHNITRPQKSFLYDELPLLVRSTDFKSIAKADVFPLLMSSQVFQPAWDITEPRQPELKFQTATIKQSLRALKLGGRTYPHVRAIEVSIKQADGNLFVDTYYVDEDHPNRILLRWERYDGSILSLEELYYSPYWSQHNVGDRFTDNQMK